MRHIFCIVICALSVLAAASSAPAQTVEELKQRLAEEKAKSAELMRRIEALEQQLAARQPKTPSATDEDSSRALERALVREGGLLLPPLRVEVEPGFAWVHSDPSDPYPIRNAYDTFLGLRVGLPGGLQLSASLPYSTRTEFQDRTDRGIRDLSGSVAKQLVRGKNGHPSLLADFGWTTPTGQTGFDGRVPLGSGFEVGRGRLTFVQSVEPVVFVAQASFARARSRLINGTDVRPGDQIGGRFGTSLAATPNISMFFGVNVSHFNEARRGGLPVVGSDGINTFFESSLGIVLSRHTFLSIGGSFGVSGAGAPDTVFDISLPVRF
jgi:hypothetical protein